MVLLHSEVIKVDLGSHFIFHKFSKITKTPTACPMSFAAALEGLKVGH